MSASISHSNHWQSQNLIFWLMLFAAQQRIEEVAAANEQYRRDLETKTTDIQNYQTQVADLQRSLKTARLACLDAYVESGNSERVVETAGALIETMRLQMEPMELAVKDRDLLELEIAKVQFRVGHGLTKAKDLGKATMYLGEAYLVVSDKLDVAEASLFRQVHMAWCDALSQDVD
jgi:hypothetical protein